MMEIIKLIWDVLKFFAKYDPARNDKLLSACKERRLDEVQSLLESCADVNAKDSEGHTPLRIASSKYGAHRPSDEESFHLVCLLLRYGLERRCWRKIRINDRDNKGNTALMMAARNDAKKIVKKLCDHGADVTLKNDKGYTALMRAKKHGYTETARILIEHGARE